jgi:anti-sigma regulatory factor (Ser/Thr protein kinase)
MHTMTPGRAAELHARRIRLAAGPAAAADARGQVRAAINAWGVPVDTDAAVLLTSELVTNAIKHAAGEAVTLGIRHGRGRLRVEVHDTSFSLPALTDTPAGAEAGRGLILVASLSAEWGFYRTPAGKAVYFTLASRWIRTAASDRKVPRPRMPDEEPDRPAGEAREDAGFSAHEPSDGRVRSRLCRRCCGLAPAHYLTCPLLRRPGPAP